MKEIFKISSKYIWQIFGIILLSLLQVTFNILTPRIIANIIDNGIAKGDLNYAMHSSNIILFIAFANLFFSFLTIYLISIVSRGIGASIRSNIYMKANEFSIQDIEDITSASLLTRVTNDTNKISRVLAMTAAMAIRGPVLLIFSVIMIFKLDAKLALIAISVLPLIILFAGIIGYIVKPIFHSIQKKIDELNRVVQDNVNGIMDVKTYTLEKKEEEKFAKINKDVKDTQSKVVIIISLAEPLFTLLVVILMIVIINVGGKLVLEGSLLTGNLVALISYLSNTFVAIMILAVYFIFSISSATSFRRIIEVLKREPSIKEIDNPIDKISNHDIEFKNVYFKYPTKSSFEKSDKSEEANNANTEDIEANNSEYILNNISFRIPQGQSLGVLGPTGSGKSTIAALLNRFYDTDSGEILIGGNNIKNYSFRALNSNIAYVEQKNKLFKGNIRNNLLMGDKNASDDDLIWALKEAQAYDFVIKYDDFLDHQVLTNGNNFSGGQKQRLSIARALLKKSNILILDDSTSALDFETERKIQKSINSLHDNNLTQIIISQRISSIKNCNNIIVLEDGKIIASGNHDKLLDSCSYYKEVATAQGGINE